MDPRRNSPNLGAVMTAVLSPTRILLVRDRSRPNALYKLPGGTIEASDGSIEAAAAREVFEETGIILAFSEVELIIEQQRDGRTYYPYFCIAQVSEEKFDSRERVGDEDGKPIEIAVFARPEVPTMLDLLERHRHFIKAIEEASVST